MLKVKMLIDNKIASPLSPTQFIIEKVIVKDRDTFRVVGVNAIQADEFPTDPVMSQDLEAAFSICIKRISENQYEPDKINCLIMDLKSKVLLEMAKCK